MATPEELLTESWKNQQDTTEDLLKERRLTDKTDKKHLGEIQGEAAIKYDRCRDYQNGTKTI